ncbi:MAG: hypothetical protein U1E76_11110 [Planctomycetota bacterium]
MLFALLAWLPACGQVDAALESFASAQDNVVVVGIRRYTAKLGSRFESTRERITLAGGGRYRIDLLAMNGEPPEQMDEARREQFDRLARRFQGSLGRRIVLERDLRVRDLRLAGENYWVEVDASDAWFLGRKARRLTVADKFRAHGTADRPSYELTVDLETGFIVRSIEKNADGEMVSEMAYESIDWRPDLSGIDVASFDYVGRLQPGGKAGDPDCAVFVPTWLPPGFVSVGEVISEVDAHGQKVKVLEIVYSDGIQEIAVFENRSLERTTLDRSPGRQEPYEVRVDYLGSLALSEFSIGQTFLHIESKIAPQDLATVIESLAQR